MRFVNLGSCTAYVAPEGGIFSELSHQGEALRADYPLQSLSEGEVALHQQDRMTLVSEGIVNACGGRAILDKLLTRYLRAESMDLLNELIFQAKQKRP